MTDTTSIKHPTPLTSGDFTAAEEPFALFGEWFAEAVKAVGGKVEDREAFLAALKKSGGK